MQFKILDTTDVIYQQALALRYQCFFQNQQLPWEILFDRWETSSVHLVLLQQTDVIAYGRLTEVSPGIFQVSQMAVQPGEQCKGFGNKLLHKLIQLAMDENACELFLHARIDAAGFYKKNGFIKSGEAFKSTKTGIDHFRMDLILKK